MQLNPRLAALGWNEDLARQVGDDAEFVVLRVVAVRRTNLQCDDGDALHTVAFPHAARWSEQVTVGDWVLARRGTGHRDASLYLHRVLERRNGLRRLAAGQEVITQWLAANLDAVFVMLACDASFAPARAERFASLALQSGIPTLFVLTKADVHPDPAALLATLPRDVPAVAIDARKAGEYPEIRERLGVGRTVALLGTSGVGKSTLVNALAGGELQATGAVRARDARGRHTTTARRLVKLPTGGVIIDTPGIRELALVADEAGMEHAFADLFALAAQCRFGDCGHGAEPGCALTAAIAGGTLAPGRLASFRKLLGERAALVARGKSGSRKNR